MLTTAEMFNFFIIRRFFLLRIFFCTDVSWGYKITVKELGEI